MSLNSLNQGRSAGILLHISSLPSGDLGEDASRFVDFLVDIGASVWQTLPLNMPHDDGSPYQCLSAHAGNPAFISLKNLVAQNLLNKQDLAIESTGLKANRHAILGKAYMHYKQHSNIELQKEFVNFCHANVGWLGDFALFLVLREKFKHISWNAWPNAYKNKQPAVMKKVKLRYALEIAVIKFTQFLFFRQWQALKTYANKHGVAMFGDIPIFVAFDSADVWAKPHLFKLDSNKNMQVVAGVPPDYFCATGQRWGNPHYNWQAMHANGFKWWLMRMRTQQRMFDMLRIDHFRGLQAAWEVPANEGTAINGKWAPAPGNALLHAITKRFPSMYLIAEDLGVITEEVDALRERYNMPGMKILQFAFGGDDKNPYLPQNIEQNSVVYTGTHDNDTTLGWYLQLDEHAKNDLHAKLNANEPETNKPNMPHALIELALGTKANMAIIPMQDVLGLDTKHRMNTPGTMGGNWQWRFDWDALQKKQIECIKKAIKQSNRANKWH
jgi:4-alpha-glucanotransferase